MLRGNIELFELSHEELCYIAKHRFSIKKCQKVIITVW